MIADMPAEHPDDIALVIARTRPLDTDDVATREVPADTAAVADTRSWAADRATCARPASPT
ncbi:hypothetical protein [Streptomyces sp. NPDC001508]|uniref:hypothetical protein n=1 Tax=Streptomyces sp. NPDC001508 TaxID=3154656 RepID=UPI003316AE46